MHRRDYRPYCFDSCNQPLKTRFQQLVEAIKGEGSEIEVKVKVDEEMLNKAVEDAIKKNPVKIDVDIDDSKIAATIKADFKKVHSHITCAENNIIETLSCNCDSGCGCEGHNHECSKKECDCNAPLTKKDLAEAVTLINEHTDNKVDTLSVKTEAYFEEVESAIENVQESVQTIIEKVDETNSKVDDFRELYDSFHD